MKEGARRHFFFFRYDVSSVSVSSETYFEEFLLFFPPLVSMWNNEENETEKESGKSLWAFSRWVECVSLFCNLLIAAFRARWCANAFCWSFFLVKVWKRELWRGEANKSCSACKERTACFSSMTALLVCILFDVVELIGFHVDLNSIEWITESKWIVEKIKDLCMLCGFTQAWLLQHQCCFHPVRFPEGSQHFFLSSIFACLIWSYYFCEFDVILLCLPSLWSAGVAEPHCYVFLCSHVCVKAMKLKKKICPPCWRCCWNGRR